MKMKRRFRNQNAAACVPLLAVMVIAFLFPMCIVFKMSFFSPDFTLEHYISFFTKKTYIEVYLRTFKTALTVTLGCLIIGYPLAFYMSTLKQKTADYLRIFVTIPFWVSILIRTFAWKIILSNTGVVNTWLLDLGYRKEPLSLLYNSFAVNLSMIHIELPFMVLTLYGVMKGINASYYNAALSLGAKPGRAFWGVYFPMSMPGIMSGTLMVFITSLGFYITPSILGGSSDTMLPVVIDMQVNTALNWNFACALAVILLVTTSLIVVVYTKILGVKNLGGVGV